MQYHKSHHFPAVINLHCKCWSSNMWHPISITFPIYLFAVEPTLLKVWYYISTKCDSFGSSMETLCQIWHLVPKKQPIYDNFPIPGWHMQYLLGKKSTIFMVVCLCSLWIPLLPAASCIGGFKESGSAYRKCRSCMVLPQELRSKVHMCIIYLVEKIMTLNN